MKCKRLIEATVYTVIIVLGIVALALVAASPPEFANNKIVYQGF